MYGGNGKSNSIELQDNPTSVAGPSATVRGAAAPLNESGAASGSTKRHGLDGLKKRFGSLRKKKNTPE